MFQNLFEVSENLACGVKNSGLQVIHKSLLYEEVENEDKDTSFLEKILKALEEKKNTKGGKLKILISWISSKLCFLGNENKKNEQTMKTRREKEVKEKLSTEFQKLEDAIVDLSKKVGEESKGSNLEELSKEVDEVKERIYDLRDNIGEEEKKSLPLIDTPNTEGNTALHLSILLGNPEATSLLLEYEADPNIQDSDGRTALHLACDQRDIEQATKLVRHQVFLMSKGPLTFRYMAIITFAVFNSTIFSGKNGYRPDK